MVEKRGQWACKSIGYIVFWPAKWLQDKNEEKYLKVQGSAGWLSRLVCNCSSRSTSIANGTKLGELKRRGIRSLSQVMTSLLLRRRSKVSKWSPSRLATLR